MKEEMRKKLSSVSKEDRAVVETFNTEQGKIALEYLRAIFSNQSCYVDGNTNRTMYKCGQADVIGFIDETFKMVKGADDVRIVKV